MQGVYEKNRFALNFFVYLYIYIIKFIYSKPTKQQSELNFLIAVKKPLLSCSTERQYNVVPMVILLCTAQGIYIYILVILFFSFSLSTSSDYYYCVVG